MDAAFFVSFLLFILVTAILLYFILDYVESKKDVNKLIKLNRELLDGVNRFTSDYKNLVDIIEVQTVLLKYKNKYKELEEKFEIYKLYEDTYEHDIVKRKKKSMKTAIKKIVKSVKND